MFVSLFCVRVCALMHVCGCVFVYKCLLLRVCVCVSVCSAHRRTKERAGAVAAEADMLAALTTGSLRVRSLSSRRLSVGCM